MTRDRSPATAAAALHVDLESAGAPTAFSQLLLARGAPSMVGVVMVVVPVPGVVARAGGRGVGRRGSAGGILTKGEEAVHNDALLMGGGGDMLRGRK